MIGEPHIGYNFPEGHCFVCCSGGTTVITFAKFIWSRKTRVDSGENFLFEGGPNHYFAQDCTSAGMSFLSLDLAIVSFGMRPGKF